MSTNMNTAAKPKGGRRPRKNPKLLPTLPLDPHQRYTVLEACAYLRISRGYFYAKIHEGEIRLIRDGGRTFVPGSEIARLSALPQEAA